MMKNVPEHTPLDSPGKFVSSAYLPYVHFAEVRSGRRNGDEDKMRKRACRGLQGRQRLRDSAELGLDVTIRQ